MGFEGGGGGMFGYGILVLWYFVALDGDILVGGSAAFGGHYMREVFLSDFVDDAYEAFLPAGFVVCGRWGGLEACFLGRGERRWLCCAVPGVGEAGFDVGEACQVECHDQLWDDDVDLG